MAMELKDEMVATCQLYIIYLTTYMRLDMRFTCTSIPMLRHRYVVIHAKDNAYSVPPRCSL